MPLLIARFRLKPCWFILLLCLPTLASADLVREWLTAEEAARFLPQGEQVWLKTGTERFWAIYRESDRKQPRGAAIVLSDPSSRPFSANLMGNIAATLRQSGWQILLLQPPIADSLHYQRDATTRLESAIAFLAEKKHRHIALLGVGDSALATLEYAAQHPPPPPPTAEQLNVLRQNEEPMPQPPPGVRLIALVDLPWNAQGVLAWLAQTRMPVADYYHIQDNNGQDDWARQRRVAAKNNDAYRQLRLAQLDPLTDADYAMLARRLIGWMGNAMRTEIDKWPKPDKNTDNQDAVPTPEPAKEQPAPASPTPEPASAPTGAQPPVQAPIQSPTPIPIQVPEAKQPSTTEPAAATPGTTPTPVPPAPTPAASSPAATPTKP